MKIDLNWGGELLFTAATQDGREQTLDGGSEEGLSPVEALTASLAGCMAIDVIDILGKMREDVQALQVELEGERNNESPQYLKTVSMSFHIKGKANPEKVRRAIELSREKYCSVLHSLRSDLAFSYSFEIDEG